MVAFQFCVSMNVNDSEMGQFSACLAQRQVALVSGMDKHSKLLLLLHQRASA